jgi:hypothetical protein
MASKFLLMDTSRREKNAIVGHLNVQYSQFLVLNDVPILRYKESIRDTEWSEPVELRNIDDEG